MAEHDLNGGASLIEQIGTAIEECDRVLPVLSANSIVSAWVITEFQRARERERRTQSTVLFPIRLIPFDDLARWTCFDSDSGEDVAKAVRRYYIPDFSQWQIEQHYRAAFDRLLHDLADQEHA